METKLKNGKVWNIFFDEEKNKYIVKSNYYEYTYIFSSKKRANDTFTELEKQYKKK